MIHELTHAIQLLYAPHSMQPTRKDKHNGCASTLNNILNELTQLKIVKKYSWPSTRSHLHIKQKCKLPSHKYPAESMQNLPQSKSITIDYSHFYANVSAHKSLYKKLNEIAYHAYASVCTTKRKAWPKIISLKRQTSV